MDHNDKNISSYSQRSFTLKQGQNHNTCGNQRQGGIPHVCDLITTFHKQLKKIVFVWILTPEKILLGAIHKISQT